MRQSRRKFIAMAGMAAVAGCTGPSADATSGESLGVTAPTLLLNWKVNGLHAPYFAARANGFYEEEGFDEVAIESGQGSDFAAKQVALGNQEFGISSSDQILNVNSGELSPRAVGVVMQRNPVVVFSARESLGEELTDPAQLAGTTVGSGPGMVRSMTRGFLEVHGVLEDVEYVDTGFDTVQQLLTGEVAAAGGVFSDVVDARMQGYEVDVLGIDPTIPSYGHLVSVSEDFAAGNPETVRAFLRATARGAIWANNNPSEAIDFLVEARPSLETSRENQRAKWDRLRETYMLSETVREQGWGWSSPEPWTETYEILSAGEFIEGEVDPDAVWTNDYLDQDGGPIAEFATRISE